MTDPFRHHERHPVTGACVWCGVNSTSSVGCTRGPDEVERLQSQLSAALARAKESEKQNAISCDALELIADELDRTKVALGAAEMENEAWRALADAGQPSKGSKP